jgi:hypothetical protein
VRANLVHTDFMALAESRVDIDHEPLLKYHTLPTDCRNEDCRSWR